MLFAVAAGVGLFVFEARENSLKDNFRIAFFDAAESRREEVVIEYYDALGATGMFQVLEEENPACHFEAHEIGKAVYKDTEDLNDSIKICGKHCTGGCFHGALIEAFKDIVPKPDLPESHIELADLKNKMQELCSREVVTDIHREGKCIHGVGHALTFLSDYNLDQAISYCELLGDKPREHYCAEGAFMEFIFLSEFSRAKTELSHYPCDTYTKFPAACYRSQAQKIRQVLENPEKVGEECLKLSGFNRLGCFYGMGFAYSNDVRGNPRMLPNLCRQGNADDKRICIEGAMEKPEDPQFKATADACEYLGDELKPFCLTAYNNKSYSLSKSFELYFDQFE